MKRNAVIRIVIYSLLLVLLLGVALHGIFGFRMYDWNWGYRDRWEASEVPMDSASGSINANEITRIQVEWAQGDIIVQTGDGHEITVSEERAEGAEPMNLSQKGTQLNIQFAPTTVTVGFGFKNPSSKDLLITVPRDWVCRELEFDVAKGMVKLQDLNITELDFDGAAVDFVIENCTVGEMDVDTASGDVRFAGSLDTLDFDAASGDFEAVFQNVPRSLTMDGMSSNMDITLPQDVGFTATIETLSGRFTSDYATTAVNGAHVYGDGKCRINVEGMSGDLVIRKGQ